MSVALSQGRDVDVITDGAAAFATLIAAIDAAQRSISINMFIWRDDLAGNRVADAILRAADRGVHVVISKDKLGAIFELGEEGRQSFLHKNHDLSTAIKQRVINAFSAKPSLFANNRQSSNMAACALRRHPRVELFSDRVRNDHSKYVIIDDIWLFFGGMNFEERFVSRDATGSSWHDYVFCCHGVTLVKEFRRRVEGRPASIPAFEFLINRHARPSRFEIGPRIISLLKRATTSCHIEMAYFGDAEISRQIVAAALRGVDVQIIVPRRANIQQAKNSRILSRMYKQSGGRIAIYQMPAMLHAKMMDIDGRTIVVGSTNFNERSIRQFAELNVQIRGDLPCARVIRHTFIARRRVSRRVSSTRKLAYSRVKASCERVFG